MSTLLFTPYTIGGITLSNRIVIPPMCQYSARNGGMATDWHRVHYGNLSLSGAGMLIVEATAVMPEGRISNRDLGLWSDETAEALAKVVSTIRTCSSMPLCVQLAHAGRKASQYAPWLGSGLLPPEQGGWRPHAPSALMYSHGTAGGITPKAMDAAECARAIRAFAKAAQRAAAIGFDAVELHMAHGYLLHEFLSPISNIRADHYGGSEANRFRYPLEVFDAIREALPPHMALGVRISGADWVPGGWTVEESCRLAVTLQLRGCDYIHVSGGGLSPEQQISVGPGYQVAMAAHVRAALLANIPQGRAAAMPVIAVGLITEPEQADTIIRCGQADCVAIGRGMLYNPRWPWHAAARLGASLSAAPQYWRGAPHNAPDLFKE